MKTLVKKLSRVRLFLITLLCSSVILSAYAQQSNNIEIQEPFSAIDVKGTIKLILIKGDVQKLEAEGQSLNLNEYIVFSVENGKLFLDTKKSLREKTDVVLTYKELNEISTKSVATIKSGNPLVQEFLTLKAESASDIILDIEVNKLNIEGSGAATIKLKGKVNEMNADLSGAADLKAGELIVTNATVDAKGAADARVFVEKQLKATTSGAADVKLMNEPEELISNSSGASEIKKKGINKEIEVLLDNENEEKNEEKVKKFKGHWAGIELGMNMLLDKSFGTTISDKYNFLELNQPKSITVQINFFEKSIPLISNKFGLVTGLGYWVNNYRFSNNVILTGDSVNIFGFYDTTKNYTKSKLTTSYLTLPLIFEFQTRNEKGKQAFHIGCGAYGGLLVGARTKVVYKEGDNKIKIKDNDSYHLNPFKYGLTTRIGWNKFSIYANYNLSTFFKNSKQPELYPFEIGITLAGF